MRFAKKLFYIRYTISRRNNRRCMTCPKYKNRRCTTDPKFNKLNSFMSTATQTKYKTTNHHMKI